MTKMGRYTEAVKIRANHVHKVRMENDLTGASTMIHAIYIGRVVRF